MKIVTILGRKINLCNFFLEDGFLVIDTRIEVLIQFVVVRKTIPVTKESADKVYREM